MIISKDKYIYISFLISIFYWIYLALTSHMDIVFDATDYESLGKMLLQNGWLEYFKTGPHREPFYPMLVAFSMGIEQIFGISYQFIQILIQLFILFVTQILTLQILRLLKIDNLLCALTILYIGISPALVNSALSLYSEIATYPFILGITLVVYKSWISLTRPWPRLILLAIVAGLLFVIMTLNKGIFELMTPAFLLLLLISAFFTRNRKIVINFIVYLAVFLAVFYLPINVYKLANKYFNGHFAITNRGTWMLYGETALRTEPLAKERFFIALARVPGEGVLKHFVGKEKKASLASEDVDVVGYKMMAELNKRNTPQGTLDDALLSFSAQRALHAPAQYILFTSMEILKMFFWESTQIGYVTYPAWLTKIFIWTPFKNGLRLGMSLLTIFALLYLSGLLWQKRKDLLEKEGPLLILYLLILFILVFAGSYSIFACSTRFFLPIAPLYLIMITYFFQKRCFHD